MVRGHCFSLPSCELARFVRAFFRLSLAVNPPLNVDIETRGKARAKSA
jgi:hypothetical protein